MLVGMTASKGGLCCAFFQQQSGKVRERGKQTGIFWRLGMSVFIVCTMTLARRGCAVVVGRCMGRIRFIFGREEAQRFLSAED
jgi:hypothetical protein